MGKPIVPGVDKTSTLSNICMTDLMHCVGRGALPFFFRGLEKKRRAKCMCMYVTHFVSAIHLQEDVCLIYRYIVCLGGKTSAFCRQSCFI